MADTIWRCACGATEIVVSSLRQAGSPVVCYCADCRAFPRVLDRDAVADAGGGIALYQTTPERLEVIAGAENLACLRLTRRGPLRWYARCCDTPMAITAPMRGVPFVTLYSAWFDDPDLAGAPIARVHRDSATGPVPRPRGSLARMVLGLLRRSLASRLGGGWRRSPFFGPDGRPVAEVEAPPGEALAAAYGTATPRRR